MFHPVSPHMAEPMSRGLRAVLDSADIAVANCEVSGFDPEIGLAIPQAESGGLWLNAGPATLADLGTLGFNMVSRANNHAGDFGAVGLAETDRLLRCHGLVHAGTGETLSAARAPAYLSTPGGRMALIAATTTFTMLSTASHARHDARGRPGVNAIRAQRLRVVDDVTFRALQAALDVATRRGANLGYRALDNDTIRVLSSNIRKSSGNDDQFILNSPDVEENLDAVRTARQSADCVVFSLHTHLPADDSDTTPESIQEFARRIVDAGADAVVCHGPHRLRAIEVYRGRPILHSLGHFVCHLHKVNAQPADAYESRGLDARAARMADLLREDGFWGQMLSDPSWWESVIARATFEDGSWKRLELFPIDLCQSAIGSQRGTPRMADTAHANRILAHLQSLSMEFGTKIEICNGIGTVDGTGCEPIA